MDWKTKGYPIEEMARMSGISRSAAYRRLDEIARIQKTSRDNLLYQPHSQYSDRKGDATMDIHKLTAKKFHLLVKRGYTLVDFCAEYQCDEHDLKDRMYRIFQNNEHRVNEAYGNILANAKKRNGTPCGVRREFQSAPESALLAANQSLGITAFEAHDPSVTQIPTQSHREQLEAKLRDLRDERDRLKSEYSKHDRGYSEVCSSIAALNAEIEELRDRLAEKEGRLAQFEGIRDQHFQERASLRSARDANEQAITEITDEIRRLDTVHLIACDDGTIEAIDNPAFAIDDTGHEETYLALVNDTKYEDLRAKDIRLLARILAIIKNSQECPIEVTFDSEMLQQIYDSRLLA